MREFDETTITAAVLERVSGARDPRLRQISEALVRHLHAFVREIEPTEDEWAQAIQFLTETGHLCTDVRQEFILLSDTLGVSMLVDAINHRLPQGATETTVLGPFYVPPPGFSLGEDIRGGLSGAPMHVSGMVTSAGGAPLADAIVDVWHADEHGFYDLQTLDERPGYGGRGRFHTDADGRFHFWTARPSAYPIPDDGPVGRMLKAQNRHPFRPEHVHFMISAPGHRKLVTHIFAAGDAYLDADVVFGVKVSLIEAFQAHDGGVAPDGRAMGDAWFSLARDFRLAPNS
jgi:hydroxyquinol 1,2-dioxygenase